MPTREFTDRLGRAWRVWSTVPSIPRALSPEFEQGWLTFESGDELRRHAPIPAQWAELPDDQLERLCRAASPAVSRLTRSRGAEQGPGGTDAR